MDSPERFQGPFAVSPSGGWLQPPQGLAVPQPILMPCLEPPTLEQQADLTMKAKEIEALQQHVAYLQHKLQNRAASADILHRLREEVHKAPRLGTFTEHFVIAEDALKELYTWLVQEGPKLRNYERNKKPLEVVVEDLALLKEQVKMLEGHWQQLEAIVGKAPSDARFVRSAPVTLSPLSPDRIIQAGEARRPSPIPEEATVGTSPAAQKTPSSEASPASPNAFGLPKEVQGWGYGTPSKWPNFMA
eukprot:symbB.v1.2.012245.t1/scaffold837.1/size158912/15